MTHLYETVAIADMPSANKVVFMTRREKSFWGMQEEENVNLSSYCLALQQYSDDKYVMNKSFPAKCSVQLPISLLN